MRVQNGGRLHLYEPVVISIDRNNMQIFEMLTIWHLKHFLLGNAWNLKLFSLGTQIVPDYDDRLLCQRFEQRLNTD